MLNLENHITISKEVIAKANLCDYFSPQDLRAIGEWCAECYESDKASRLNWLRRSEAALDLAMQMQEEKSFPWAGCSNIIFPLVTIAALQFHARAYPVIVGGKDIVRCQTFGDDPTGVSKDLADRISSHMSWQLLNQDTNWEEDVDRSLLNVAIVGCGFKKTYFSPEKLHNISEFVPAKDLVFDYWAKSIDEAKTKTHTIPYSRNDIYTAVKSERFYDCLNESWYAANSSPISDPQRSHQDARDGLTVPNPSDNTPFILCEQHCWLDLDGDGYEEPYIVTFEESSHCVLRIVTRFDRIEDVAFNASGEILKITPWEYFTKIPFIPSPDGSIMDIGFGTLLGPLNESVNAAINQLFDAGTLSNTAGGFLGRGAKLRGGVYEFSPFSWQRVDSTGDDLRKSIFPLPVREPSNVMFQLLGLIIDYSGRITGATEINVGENPGQNTPAETSRTMAENGQRIYTAIFKRIWRGFKQEFRKLYNLNAVFMPMRVRYGTSGAMITRDDYAGSAATIAPAADPMIASVGERYAKAFAVKQLASNNPAYDVDAVEVDVLKALGVSDVERVYKGAANAPPPQPDIRLQIQQMKTQLAMQELEFKKQSFVMGLQNQARLNEAKISEIQSQVFKIYEDGKSVAGSQRIEAFRAYMEMLREQNKSLDNQIQSMVELGNAQLESRGISAGIPGMETASSDTGSFGDLGQTNPGASSSMGFGEP